MKSAMMSVGNESHRCKRGICASSSIFANHTAGVKAFGHAHEHAAYTELAWLMNLIGKLHLLLENDGHELQ